MAAVVTLSPQRLVRIGYGVGNLAYSLPYQVSASFFMFFATAILLVPPTLAALASALSAVWDALADPLIGYLSDNTESRLGRRHPFLILGAALIAVCTAGLWSISPALPLRLRLALVVVLLLSLKSGLAVYVIPYLALGGELSTDYDERSAIQGVRAVFYLIGMIIAVAGATMVFFRSSPAFPRGQLNPAAYPRMALAFAALAAIAAIVAIAATGHRIPSLPQRTEIMRRRTLSIAALYRELFAALRNRNLLALAVMILVLEGGFQFGINLGVHVNTYSYGLSGPMIGVLALTVLGTSVVSQPFWVWFARAREKKAALILGLTIGLIGFVGAPWAHVWWRVFPLNAASTPWTLGAFMVIAGFGNGAFMSIPNAMIIDAAALEELRSGERNEGLYFGIYTLAYKLGTAFSWMASGLALSWLAFNPALPAQGDTTRFQLAMAPTYFLLASLPVVVAAISRYDITRARSLQAQMALRPQR